MIAGSTVWHNRTVWYNLNLLSGFPQLQLLCANHPRFEHPHGGWSYLYPHSQGQASVDAVQTPTKVCFNKSSCPRYRQIEKALINSNEPVLALGATFSSTADSHLVAVQPLEPTAVSTSASEYETQAINIASKPKKCMYAAHRLCIRVCVYATLCVLDL